MYEISKKKILELSKDSVKTKVKLKQWFPDVFYNGWYCVDGNSDTLVKIDNDKSCMTYGFIDNVWYEDASSIPVIKGLIPCSDEHVRINFVNIAIRACLLPNTRNSYCNFDINGGFIKQSDNNNLLFSDGKWHIHHSRWVKLEREVDGVKHYDFAFKTYTFRGFSHGFINGEFHSNILDIGEYNSFTYMSSEEIKQLLLSYFIKNDYKNKTLTPLRGVDGYVYEDETQWTYTPDSDRLYTERIGNGGMLVYDSGEFCQMFESAIDM